MDPLNPTGELCGRCGKPAAGYAFINGVRYCHGDGDLEYPHAVTCYEIRGMDLGDLNVIDQCDALIRSILDKMARWAEAPPTKETA
jgi:hypothetical protein